MRASEKLLVFGLFLVASVFVFSGSALAACTPNNPEIIVSPSSLAVNPGDIAAFSVKVTNKDDGSCSLNNFTLTGTSLEGFGINFNPSTLFMAPGASETSLMKVSIPSNAATKQSDVTAKATSSNYSSTSITVIDVQQKIDQCSVSLNNLRFQEKNSNVFETQFSKDDELTSYADLSMLNGVNGNVTIQLFADGSLVDSNTNFYPGNSQTTYKFGTKIFTSNYADKINMRAVATPACNPGTTSEDTETIDISKLDTGARIEMTLGIISNIVLGEDVNASVFIKNKGSNSTLINLDASLCRVGFNCTVEMSCGDSIFLIQKDELKELKCTARPQITDQYWVNAELTFEGEQDNEISNIFYVKTSSGQIVPGTGTTTSGSQTVSLSVNYTCSGDIRQATFPTSQGIKTSDVEFCQFGCIAGECLKEPPFQKAKPKTTTGSGVDEMTNEKTFSRPQFNPYEFDFAKLFDWIKNLLFPEPS